MSEYKKKEINLVVSPDKKYWDTSKPILFAGEWCLDPLQKKYWKNINYKLLDSEMYETTKIIEEINLCEDIYEKLLNELTEALNELHQINWSKRSWRIVIGPWLERYVAIINNKLNLLSRSKKNYNINFKFVEFQNDSLISFDVKDYNDKVCSNKWNEKVLRRLNKLYDEKHFDLNYLNKLKLEKFPCKTKNLLTPYFQLLKNKINFFWNIFPLSKKNNFFLHKIYIGNFYTSLKLFLGLKNFPVRYFLDESRVIENFNVKLRKKLNINFDVKNLNEKIIRYLMVESIPTIYIEGFQNMMNKIESSNLPKKMKNIFTCNSWSDTVLKFWIAQSVNEGSYLFYGQHGSGYGVIKKHCGTKHEIKISDKYLTWGWNNKKLQDKIIPCVCFPSIKDKIKKNNNKKQILLVPTAVDIYPRRNEILKPNKAYTDINILNNFINNIDKKIYNDLSFKAHSIEKRRKRVFSYFDYMKKVWPKINIYDTSKNLDKIIDNSKISIFFYFGTPFLKNLSLNKPSIMIYPYKFRETINHEFLDFFDKLEEVNVAKKDCLDAAKFINTNHNNINEWWYSDRLQTVRENFSNIFARKNKDSLKILIKSLKDNQLP